MRPITAPPPASANAAPLYRAADLRHIEAVAAEQPLMQRAGLAAADLATTLCGEHGASVLVLAGPGNNGGDAFETARHLRERFFDVRVVFTGDGARLPADAQAAWRRYGTAGGTTLTEIPDDARWSLIVDGLFGIGLQRDVAGRYGELVAQANALASRDGCPLLALDCPSGLDADTGRRRGATIRASHTLTFIAGKPGLLTGDGPDCCGSVALAALDLDAEKLVAAAGQRIAPSLFAACLRPRARNSHKGTHGSAGLLGGASGMLGAAFLAGRAALRLGAGRVYLGLLDAQAPGVDAGQPELMLRRPDALPVADLGALACGPGMGQSHEALARLDAACALDLPLVLDADALNLVAGEGNLQVALATRRAPTLLTPHPAEAARLLDGTTAAVQADRIAAALDLAARFNACVALKGCGTIVAAPDGRWFVNATGNPGLATAGTGDVLTGFVTALLAQGWPPLDALLAAVHLHGTAADALVAAGCGPLGLTAGELIDAARAVLNRWIADHAR
ncbi:MAG: bifunctional ADP-dependent (S)-NAD(P)H-hydrate dehydratase/NAD(P)H-hydrate epimerase [Candidatus Accumulibacter sp. 66-26]|nr:NAD(P)H-hydrate dehydratase [Accumulibacter sp.]OJW48427.1 MAG: bifunctional ADP-dependent (S)-NAD(P)H-hydrate dehydratase/NAD(P)H-hydrate epimerase [Candidatus Accumulibacter sp. 66-26]